MSSVSVIFFYSVWFGFFIGFLIRSGSAFIRSGSVFIFQSGSGFFFYSVPARAPICDVSGDVGFNLITQFKLFIILFSRTVYIYINFILSP